MTAFSPLVLLMFMAYLLLVMAVLTLWFLLTYRPRGRSRGLTRRRPETRGETGREASRTETRDAPLIPRTERGERGRSRARLEKDNDFFPDFSTSRRGSDTDA